ncbi:MAG: efflux RND transporter periplasmic adaptor subunit [Verrucomicrobiota bacterium]
MNHPTFRLIGLAMCLILLAGCGGGEASVIRDVVRPAKIHTVQIGVPTVSLEYPGQIEAKLDASLAFEINGRVVSLPVQNGDLVKTGDLLAKLDPRDYEASFNSAQASLTEAELALERNRTLITKNAATQAALESTESAYETALADLDVARKRLEETELRAPFDGVIARILIDDFANITAKEDIMILQDVSLLEAEANISETIWAKGKKGDDIASINAFLNPEISLTTIPGVFFPAPITEMAMAADPESRTFAVTFTFVPPETLNISPGMTAKVRITAPLIQGAPSDAAYIPASSVGYDPEGMAFVWKVDDESMAVSKVLVEPGEILDDGILVQGPLRDGDRIVSSGVALLSVGEVVKEWNN